MKKLRILLLDDEESLIRWLSYALEEKNFSVTATTEPREALNRVKQERFDCIVSDIRMPQMDGFHFLKKIREIYPSVPVIFITAYGTMDSAIAAMRDRASDYILKPFGIDEIVHRIKANIPGARPAAESIVGKSRQIQNIVALVDRIAQTDATVLVLGESGTGKEVIARQIHERSKRAGNSFLTISCAALPETLLESELFGYKKGAFTGAAGDKDGFLVAADHGTFFLDEIGDAPQSVQMKILRLLEEKEITPLGSTQPVKVDVRLVAATNKNLLSEVKKGRFREDLYYRLNIIPVVLPPLRQRREDIPVLAQYFLELACKKENRGERKLLKSAIDALVAYNWPGNVRELRHVIERAVILTDSFYIKPEYLGLPLIKGPKLDEIADAEIKKVVDECQGNIAKAARRLGISRATIYRKIKR